MSLPNPQRHVIPAAVLTESKHVPITVVRPVTTVVPKTSVTKPRQAKTVVTKTNSPPKRHINHNPSPKASPFPLKVIAVKAPMVNAAKGNPQHALKDKGVIDSGCLRHMTRNMSYLFDFEELNGGYVTFDGNPKGGKIFGKGKIITGKLDFDDVYFVKELKFNLFSVSQMCDKKNSILFTDTECLDLSPEFKLPDESIVLLRVPRENNMYNVNLKNIVPSEDLTCKFDGKVDEGFLVGYSVSSKAFRVFNSRTRIVQETLHVNFLEQKPNVAGSGPTWLFDIDTLTKTMNYQPNTDGDASFDEKDPDFEGRKPEFEVNVSPSSGAQSKKHDDKTKREAKGKSPIESLIGYGNLSAEFEDFSDNSINEDNVAGILVPAVGQISPNSTNTFSIVGPSNATASPTHGKSSCIDTSQLPDDPNMPELEDITYSNDEDDVGFEDPDYPDKVYKVVKALYGLHQAPRALKQKKDGIFIIQDKYVAEILRKFSLTDGKSVSTSIDTEKPLLKDPDGEDVDVHTYRSMIGSLMYLTSSRPDIMFTVCTCARFQVTPKASHLHAVKRIFIYLKGKPHLGLWYPKDSPFYLVAYSDSDYVCASLDMKSTTGGCQFFGCRLISWQCKKKTVVATSSTEAEYVAAASCCAQVLWIQNQLLDYGYNFMHTIIYIDNSSTICIIKNPVLHSKTKHIEIRRHFIRDCNDKKLIQVVRIPKENNFANLLTKAFDVGRFQYLVANQTVSGKDSSNPLMADNLPKIVWYSTHHVTLMKSWLVQKQTALGVNTPRCDEDMLELMELTVFLLLSDEKGEVEVSDVDLQVSAVRLILLLLVQKFLLFGLTNWCCSLSAVSEGFNRIIDFLIGSSIKYSLTVNPNIYVSYIKPFWTSIAIKKVNDVTRLQALVDKKKVVITKASIRDALRWDDVEGVECLPNEEIFTELARMGYEKPSTKLTRRFSQVSRKFNFSKYIFDSLVRNVDSPTKFYMYPRFLQLMIRKQVGDLSSHSTKYTSPALTQKVFANMRRVGKGFSGVDTPLFEGMIVAQEVVDEGDAEVNVDDVPTVGVAAEGDVSAADDVVPTADEEPSISFPTPPTPPPQLSQDQPSTSQVHLTPPQSPQVQPQSPQHQPQPSQDAGISMDLLQNLMDTCTTLTRRVEHLEHDKVAQALKITKLKSRVKKLERRNKASKLKRLKKVGSAQRIDTSDDTVMDDDVAADAKDGQDANVEDNADIQGRKAESQAEVINTVVYKLVMFISAA
nr:putative ribonuclease H-like domain-containing protein [Tanacetum cinerariifolium]